MTQHAQKSYQQISMYVCIFTDLKKTKLTNNFWTKSENSDHGVKHANFTLLNI